MMQSLAQVALSTTRRSQPYGPAKNNASLA